MANPRLRRGLAIAARLFIGFVFVYAAVGKIGEPPNFAKEVAAYKMLPPSLLNLVAIFLPWVELLVGLALLVGIYVRTAAILASGLLGVFITAIGLRFARGETNFECGCFPHLPGFIDELPVLGPLFTFFFSSTNGQVTFARDIVLLAIALVVVMAPYGWRRPSSDRRPS